MADVAPAVAATPAPAEKNKKKATKKARKPAASHPKVAEMVTEAISNLKEKNGSSLQAIKKYVGANFKVDVEKLAPFIRRYLKHSVIQGALVQTKGKGASGSFKIGGSKSVAEKPSSAPTKKVVAKKAKSPIKKTIVKPKAKKAAKVKKSPTKTKAPKPKKAPKGKKGAAKKA